MRYQLKLSDSKRERENYGKHTAGHSQNKGTEQFQRRASQRQTSPSSAGVRGEGKGANSAPEMASPTKLQTGSQFLTKDYQRFWMVDIHRRAAARGQLLRTDTRCTHQPGVCGD